MVSEKAHKPFLGRGGLPHARNGSVCELGYSEEMLMKRTPYATLACGSVQLVPDVGLHALFRQFPLSHHGPQVLLVEILPSDRLRILRVGFPPSLETCSFSSSQHKSRPWPKNMRSATASPNLLLVAGTPLSFIVRHPSWLPQQQKAHLFISSVPPSIGPDTQTPSPG